MPNSYSTILGLALPAKGDVDWDDEINGNFQKLETHAWQKMLTAPRALVSEVLAVGTVGAYLIANTLYYYKITALSALGETTVSNEVTAFEGATAFPIRLSWQPVAGATGYKIYKSAASNGEQFLVSLGAVTTYDDTGFTNVQVISPPASNTANLLTLSDTVDGFHASKTPAAGEIPVINDANKYPAKDGSLITAVDAASVSGIQAAAAATASKLYPLDGTAKFPNSVLKTGTGNGLDADTVDGFHAAQAPAANQIPVLTAAGKYPAVDGSLITSISADMVDGLHASAVPEANKLVALDANTKYPAADGSLITNVKGWKYFIGTSSGSWVVPAGVTGVTAMLVGGGGAGGGAPYSGSAVVSGAAGGGGAYMMQRGFFVSAGNSISYVIGAGGTGAAGGAGNAGGASSLSYGSVAMAAAGGNGGGAGVLSGTGGVGGAGFSGGGGGGGSGTMGANDGGGNGGNGGEGMAGAAGVVGTSGQAAGAGGAGHLTDAVLAKLFHIGVAGAPGMGYTRNGGGGGGGAGWAAPGGLANGKGGDSGHNSGQGGGYGAGGGAGTNWSTSPTVGGNGGAGYVFIAWYQA